MVNFDSFMVTLSAALGVSLLVERILEVLKNISEPLIGVKCRRLMPKFRDIDQKIDEWETVYKSNKQDGEWEERYPLNTVLVEPAADPDDGTVIRAFVLQVLGFAIGIVLARCFDLRLFETFVEPSVAIAPWMDYLLTGLLIGGGSGPIHVLMRFIASRKLSVPADDTESGDTEEKEEKPAASAAPPGAPQATELDIVYNGGVDREKLQWLHVREKDPELIIYHHTAMQSSATFEDVVRVIKSRKDSQGNPWLTGYNCVVMADGAIKPFCRWDRYGNHAAGYNMKSLGLAFNGNFETNPGVPFSNPDGKYGPPRPSEVQLKAGARLAALWSHLYNIVPDFGNSIIPHSQIAAKACPGSGFPYDEFKRWVEYFHGRWTRIPELKESIEAFKMKPFLYIGNKED